MRPRTVLYGAAHRGHRRRDALRARDPHLHRRHRAARPQSDPRDALRRLDPNGYTARLLNKRPVERRFAVEVEGLPGARVEVVGSDGRGLASRVGIGPDSTREVRLLVFAPRGAKPEKSTAVEFRIIDLASAEAATAQDFFKVP